VIPILSQDTIRSAKSVDLLSYLQRYEPDELVYVGGQEYSTKSHGSLKISNGKWHWFSRGIGGTTALDYLIHVKEMRFTEAVMYLVGQRYQDRLIAKPKPQSKPEKSASSHDFALPQAFENSSRAVAYLLSRCIARPILIHCLKNKLIYEDACYHNAVFVGLDLDGTPRHAMLRGTSPGSSFRQDAPNSDKRYSFNLPAQSKSDTLYVFEGAIDLLSRATIEMGAGNNWLQDHQLSLGGLASLALDQYLKDHPGIGKIVLCLDRDQPGREAMHFLREKLLTDGYGVCDEPAPNGKDYNDYLCSLIENNNRSPEIHSSNENRTLSR